jgi:hypothetical protein
MHQEVMQLVFLGGIRLDHGAPSIDHRFKRPVDVPGVGIREGIEFVIEYLGDAAGIFAVGLAGDRPFLPLFVGQNRADLLDDQLLIQKEPGQFLAVGGGVFQPEDRFYSCLRIGINFDQESLERRRPVFESYLTQFFIEAIDRHGGMRSLVCVHPHIDFSHLWMHEHASCCFDVLVTGNT